MKMQTCDRETHGQQQKDNNEEHRLEGDIPSLAQKMCSLTGGKQSRYCEKYPAVGLDDMRWKYAAKKEAWGPDCDTWKAIKAPRQR